MVLNVLSLSRSTWRCRFDKYVQMGRKLPKSMIMGNSSLKIFGHGMRRCGISKRLIILEHSGTRSLRVAMHSFASGPPRNITELPARTISSEHPVIHKSFSGVAEIPQSV